MGNAVALMGLVLQNLTQLQSYGATVHKALSEGRDVSTADLAAAKSALQGHLDALQALIDKGN
jgi:hypothetical protein